MSILAIPAEPKRTKPLVAIGILTRNRPDYLGRCLEGVYNGIKRASKSCDVHLMVWNNGEIDIDEATHGVGHNVGQHISMNRLIHEACDKMADYFLRVDDDCVFKTPNWLAKLVKVADVHEAKYGRTAVISPYVHGLRFPPEAIGHFKMGKFDMQVVGMLGGICRLMPMSHLRYWRFDERMPMGWSEASTYARYCMTTKMPMLRCVNVEVSHGESTDAQEADDPVYAYESEMLKMTPYGL